jgi:hypothetical protein
LKRSECSGGIEDVTEESVAAAGSFFLSYSRSDERFALKFAKDLRAHGVAVWVDQLDIRPSEHWDRAVERAVRDCRGLVVILSPHSAASDNVADEISFAIDSGKPILPVMIERCTPPLRITRMHMIDATINYEGALQQCLAEIRRGGGGANADRPEAAAPAAAGVDSGTVADAKRQLTSILGPIAGILVDKMAARARSAKDLHSLLAQHIDSDADRARFMALISSRSELGPPAALRPGAESRPSADPTAIGKEDIDRLSSALVSYLGPIAPIVSKRESETSGSLDELRQRLAGLIPDEGDRAEFLKRVR